MENHSERVLSSGPMPRTFVVDGLPRTGSTTFARILNCHPEIHCLVEPFHPNRYEGQFNRLALETGMQSVLPLIHQRWNGIKHVWEPLSGWPFRNLPQLNDDLALAGGDILFMRRRNFLRRYVSGAISQRLGFWVGTRREFLWRLEHAALVLDPPELIRARIDLEISAVNQRVRLLQERNIRFHSIFYEDFFVAECEEQFSQINAVFKFVGAVPLARTLFDTEAAKFLNRQNYQWANDDIYRRISGIAEIESYVASAERGYLFEDSKGQ
jgi:hypothetical protein